VLVAKAHRARPPPLPLKPVFARLGTLMSAQSRRIRVISTTTGAGTQEDPFVIHVRMRPPVRYHAAKEARLLDSRFDVGNCDNTELLENIVQATMNAGWPYTKALYRLGCVNKELRELVRAYISPVLSKMRKLECEWTQRHYDYVNVKLRKDFLINNRFGALAPPPPTELLAVHETILAQEQDVSFNEALEVRWELEATIESLAGRAAAASMTQIHHMLKMKRKGDGNPLRKGLWNGFPYSWILMAHVAQELCMACSGLGIRCNHPADGSRNFIGTHPESTMLGDFCFPCSQAGAFFYAKQQCIEWQSIIPWPQGRPEDRDKRQFPTSPLQAHVEKLKGNPAKRHIHTGMLATAMVRLRCPEWLKFRLDAAQALFEARGLVQNLGERVLQSSEQSKAQRLLSRQCLFLNYNRYIDAKNTLAGRLGLTPQDVRYASRETERALELRDLEVRAVAEVRMRKFANDVEVHLCRELPDHTFADLTRMFPTMEATIKRYVETGERDMYRAQGSIQLLRKYRDALSDANTRGLCDRIVYGVSMLKPYESTMGICPPFSAEAYEWLLNLTSGAVPGQRGDWREYLDSPPQRSQLEYGDSWRRLWHVAAMHVFDGLGKESWKLSIGELKGESDPALPISGQHHRTNRVAWVLHNSNRGVTLRDVVDARTSQYFSKWHKMMMDCYNASCREHDELDVAAPDSRTIEKGIYYYTEFVQREPVAFRKIQSYFQDLCDALVPNPATRHAVLLFLGISPQELCSKLRNFHAQWLIGAVRPLECVPVEDTDFVHWLCDNPDGRVIRTEKLEPQRCMPDVSAPTPEPHPMEPRRPARKRSRRRECDSDDSS